jgi:hypothetical protein
MDPADGSDVRPPSLHRYIYAGVDPVDNVDPTGREYDMVSITASISADSALSNLATVSLAAIAADIICQAGEYSGTPVNPKKCPAQYFLNYESQDTYEKVWSSEVILAGSTGLVYLTQDIYYSGEAAWDSLAVLEKPVGYWRIPSSSLQFIAYGGLVLPKLDAYGNLRPGGASEWYTNPPVPIDESTWVPIGP